MKVVNIHQLLCTVESKINENGCKQKLLTNPGNGYFIQVYIIYSGLENCTRPLVFTSGRSVRASGNCHLLARQDE